MREPQVEEGDEGGYALAGGGAKRARAVRAGEGALPGVGVSAQGVRQATAPTTATHTPAEILTAFRGEIAPFRASVMYLFWLLIGVGLTILLPLVYLGLIGLAILAVGYHAVHHIAMFQHLKGGAALRFGVLAYVAPLVGGLVMVGFMLKPLFARPARRAKGRTIDPQAEPLVYAFIDGVCTSVGAPRPKRIEVDCQVNAAAGFTGGAFSIFAREPYVVVGLGLVAGLDLKQLAGVMAHELGHIAQGSGARLFEVISSINAWFARVVYGRDEWDETLKGWTQDEHVVIQLIGALSMVAVWLTRRVLWVLLHIGHLVNMVFLRQREFDADRYMARMIGAKDFARTSLRTRELDLASQFALSDLQSSWQQRRLPDSFPKLILANVPQIPREMIDAVRRSAEQSRTGWFDTHPSDRDRIARARGEEPGAGIFHLEGPATDVFRDFDGLARDVTFDYYRSLLGRDIRRDQLFPVAELIDTQTAAQEGIVVAARFFLKALPWDPRFPLPQAAPQSPDDPKGAKRALVEARADLQAAREACLAAHERDSEVFRRLVKAEAAWVLLKTDNPLQAEDWGLRSPTVKAAQAAREEALAETESLAAQFEPFVSAAARRLAQALALLELDAVADRVAEGRERRDEARALYPCVAHLGRNVMGELGPVLRTSQALNLLIGMYTQGKNEGNTPLTNAVLRAASSLHETLHSLRSRVGDAVDYPFEHSREDITLGRFAFPAVLPEAGDVRGLAETSGAAVDQLASLYRRALGRLAVTAEEVERALGLGPIAVEEPAEDGPTS
jgi:Zn-dependent protease with chaperone function